MNILIVDDEYMVCEGIETIIGRFGSGWSVVGKASNGIEALEILETSDVDVIITDIKMPEMNGMELMEHIYHRGYDVEIIILSSYADFEFAQKAVKYRAVNYLLKPIDTEDLIKDLQKAEQAIKERLLRRVEQKELAENKQFMNQLMLTRLLYDNHIDEAKVRSELGQVGIQLSELVILTVGQLTPLTEDRRRELRNVIFSEFKHSSLRVEDVSIGSRLLVLVIWPSQGVMDVTDIESKLERIVDQQAGASIFFGVSDVCANLSDIAATFNQSICSTDWGLKTHKPITRFRDVDEKDFMLQYPYALEHKLLFAFKSGNVEDIQSLTKELADKLFNTNNTSNLYQLVMVSTHTLAAFKRLFLEMNNSLAQLFKLDLDVHIHLDKFSDIDMVKSWFMENMGNITAQILKSKKSKSHKIIEQIKQIIYQRYDQELKISNVADELSMNASYLSDLFKQYTNMTFTDFVIEYRIQKAKELLVTDANMKIYEVAEIVGYKHPKHFSQIFKKHVGVLPADYRNMS